MATDAEWEDAWKQFFVSIDEVVVARAALSTSPIAGFAATAVPILTDPIRNHDWPSVLYAIDQFRDPSHPYLEDIFIQELRAITTTNGLAVQSNAGPAMDEAIEDSEEGKGSIEELLGDWLPGWLKKALKLLNQVLSLLRGAA
jgi:hypothetical protein